MQAATKVPAAATAFKAAGVAQVAGAVAVAAAEVAEAAEAAEADAVETAETAVAGGAGVDVVVEAVVAEGAVGVEAVDVAAVGAGVVVVPAAAVAVDVVAAKEDVAVQTWDLAWAAKAWVCDVAVHDVDENLGTCPGSDGQSRTCHSTCGKRVTLPTLLAASLFSFWRVMLVAAPMHRTVSAGVLACIIKQRRTSRWSKACNQPGMPCEPVSQPLIR